MKSSYVIGLVTLSTVVANPHADAQVLYQTGFESPRFVQGQLVGQENWRALFGHSVSAASVSSDLPLTGDQSLSIDGELAEQFPEFGGAYAGIYLQDLNYDTSTTPIVELSGDVHLEGLPARINECTAGISISLDGMLIGVGAATEGKINAFMQNLSGDFVIGPEVQPDTWYNVRAEFDFVSQNMQGFLDDVFIGVIPFTAGSDAVIDTVEIDMVGSTPMFGVTSYVDNFSVVTAIPIPTVSEWGLIIMTLLSLTAGTIVLRSRHQPAGSRNTETG